MQVDMVVKYNSYASLARTLEQPWEILKNATGFYFKYLTCYFTNGLVLYGTRQGCAKLTIG
jgi:hypothetical protein